MAGFIFDMDGVLLDSIHIWHEAEQRITDDAGVQLTKDERDHLNSLTLEEAGVWFHEQFGIMDSSGAVVRSIMDYMLDFYGTRVQPVAGAEAFAAALREAGARMCVLSSSPQSFLRTGLGHTGMKRFFPDELIVSAEDAGMTKRSPDTFARMCAMLGTEPRDTWFFDDSWYALETAHGMGLRCVGVHSNDSCGTHEELARYSELVVDDFTGLNAADFLM